MYASMKQAYQFFMDNDDNSKDILIQEIEDGLSRSVVWETRRSRQPVPGNGAGSSGSPQARPGRRGERPGERGEGDPSGTTSTIASQVASGAREASSARP